VLKLTFADRLRYKRNEGFRTGDLALPFKVLTQIYGEKREMARLTRLEPTFCLERKDTPAFWRRVRKGDSPLAAPNQPPWAGKCGSVLHLSREKHQPSSRDHPQNHSG
jgi:hypothetical protein